jgi:RNA ligase (TIGR02306 family)
MSTLKVEITKIDEILPHPNADRLELAKIKGWICVIPKSQYKVGELVIYFPIDSILPQWVEDIVFPPESKIKLEKSRVRTIKLRGAISQGLITKVSDFGIVKPKDGDDITEFLGVKKFEPAEAPFYKGLRQRSKKQINTNFVKYTDIENFKNHNTVFTPEDMVYVTEKIHGTNFRAGWVKYDPHTWWRKLLVKLHIAPEWEFVHGSRNVQLQAKMLDSSIYTRCVKKYKLDKYIPKGIVIYGEIYGDGIQKGYNYGLTNDFGLAIFDMWKDGKYLDYHINFGCYDGPFPIYTLRTMMEEMVADRVTTANLSFVPMLYRGRFDEAKIRACIAPTSVLCPEQKVMEGVVIRPEHETMSSCGRKILKMINDEYLLNKENTDFH